MQGTRRELLGDVFGHRDWSGFVLLAVPQVNVDGDLAQIEAPWSHLESVLVKRSLGTLSNAFLDAVVPWSDPDA